MRAEAVFLASLLLRGASPALSADDIEPYAFYGMCLVDGNTFEHVKAGAEALKYPPAPPDFLVIAAPQSPTTHEVLGWIIPPADIEGARAALIILRGGDPITLFESCSVYFRNYRGTDMAQTLEQRLRITPTDADSNGFERRLSYQWTTPSGIARTISLTFPANPTEEGVFAAATTFRFR